MYWAAQRIDKEEKRITSGIALYKRNPQTRQAFMWRAQIWDRSVSSGDISDDIVEETRSPTLCAAKGRR